MSDTARWVRTNRRAPGESFDDPHAARRPGPWHIEHAHGVTWCGRRPHVAAVALERAADPAEGERRCAECVRRHDKGEPGNTRYGR